jgi:hypothetical protein
MRRPSNFQFPILNLWVKYPVSEEIRRAVNRDNALKLFPRFGGASGNRV